MKVKFTIDVPDWLYRYNWKNLKNYFSYQLRPYRCSDCNTKLPHKYGEVWTETTTGKSSLGVSYTQPGYEPLCSHCLQKRIVKVASQPDFIKKQQRDSYNVASTCDVCGEHKYAFKAFRMSDGIIDNVRFCTQGSWNGHFVCLSCIKDTLATGQLRSSIYGRYKGKSVPTNFHNLPVVDGKVKFPDH